MTKVIPIGLANHYATRMTTVADGIRIVREDGAEYNYTSHDQDSLIDSVTYDASQGLLVSSIVSQAGLAVDNLELTTLDDGTLFTASDIKSRKWTNARFTMFRYNWTNPSSGIDICIIGKFGELTWRQDDIVIELRGITQAMQQDVSRKSSKTCRARLGNTRCGVDLTPYTVTGSITGVTDTQTFRDAGRTEALDIFTEGEFVFTAGPNRGLRGKIKSYLANGTFTMALPYASTVTIGDAYTAIYGCRKRLTDCATPFNNVRRFDGEPHRQLTNDITQGPVVDV